MTTRHDVLSADDECAISTPGLRVEEIVAEDRFRVVQGQVPLLSQIGIRNALLYAHFVELDEYRLGVEGDAYSPLALNSGHDTYTSDDRGRVYGHEAGGVGYVLDVDDWGLYDGLRNERYLDGLPDSWPDRYVMLQRDDEEDSSS